MKQMLAWIDNTSDRVFNQIKWALSILSGALTSSVILSLLAEI